MWEAWATGTELCILWRALLWTFVTFRTPGYTHWAAAGIHTMLPWDRSPTALILMGEVTLLRTQVWKPQTHLLDIFRYLDIKMTSIPLYIYSTHQCMSCHWHQQSFLEGTGKRRSLACWCICHWYTLRERLDTHPHLTVSRNKNINDRSTDSHKFECNARVNFQIYVATKKTFLPSHTFPLTRAKPLPQIGSAKHNAKSVNAVKIITRFRKNLQNRACWLSHPFHIWHKGCSRLLPVWRSSGIWV